MEQTGEVVKRENGAADIAASVFLKGDISGLNNTQLVQYYGAFCESLGLNPLTQPFKIILSQGKRIMYATRDAAEQLRKINGVSVDSMESKVVDGVYLVTVKGHDGTGRSDMATGAVAIDGLKGEALANAFLKAETKAKRRLTLSISGLGVIDETEAETIPGRMMSVEEAAEPQGKEKGDFAAFQKALDAAKTKAAVEKIAARVDSREWTPEEREQIKAMLEIRRLEFAA
jgi:hypothetical protein